MAVLGKGEPAEMTGGSSGLYEIARLAWKRKDDVRWTTSELRGLGLAGEMVRDGCGLNVEGLASTRRDDVHISEAGRALGDGRDV